MPYRVIVGIAAAALFLAYMAPVVWRLQDTALWIVAEPAIGERPGIGAVARELTQPHIPRATRRKLDHGADVERVGDGGVQHRDRRAAVPRRRPCRAVH